MRFDDDESYERYKQYRRNKYRYEQEQVMFPVTIVICISILISFWKYILIALVSIGAIIAAVAILYWYLKKQLSATQPVFLTKEYAQDGVEAKINVTYDLQTVSFTFNIPPNVKDGQKFVAKNILFKNKKGKTVKKNVHFQVRIKDDE